MLERKVVVLLLDIYIDVTYNGTVRYIRYVIRAAGIIGFLSLFVYFLPHLVLFGS